MRIDPAHHHPGMTIGPLPIGMVTAHGAGNFILKLNPLAVLYGFVYYMARSNSTLNDPSGGPVGIGIGLPIMTAASLVPSLPPQPSPQPPPKKLVSPDSSEDGSKDIIHALSHRTPSPNSPHSTNGAGSGGVGGGPTGLPSWANQILQPIGGMGYPVMGMTSVMGPPPVLSEPGMLYGIISTPAPPELNLSPPTNPPPGVNLPAPSVPHVPLVTTTVNSNPQQQQQQQPAGVVAGGGTGIVAVAGGQPQQQQQQHAKEIIHCKSCTLFPPNPSAPPPTTREKPPGCRTVFVGGLPENVTDEIVREIFERCGEITTVRMSKKNFCHIRFELESFVENAIYLSGYRVRIGSNSDAANIGRLHVDYAQARDDLYEWEW